MEWFDNLEQETERFEKMKEKISSRMAEYKVVFNNTFSSKNTGFRLYLEKWWGGRFSWSFGFFLFLFFVAL